MSQPPPNGPPPPYGYPPSQPHYGSAYAFVPAPVYMYPPMMAPVPPPPESSTYVTNIYQQPPVQPQTYPQPSLGEPVKVSEDIIDWVPVTPNTAYNLTHRAVKAGHEGWDGSPLWIIRAHQSGDLVPGKLAIKHRSAYIPHCGKEISVHNFEVLCANPQTIRWVPASNGQIPVGAIAAGHTVSAEPLYVGRVRHALSLTPGKVHPSHGCCYISYSGSELSYRNYEVLCRVV